MKKRNCHLLGGCRHILCGISKRAAEGSADCVLSQELDKMSVSRRFWRSTPNRRIWKREKVYFVTVFLSSEKQWGSFWTSPSFQ